jgi:hypothetical protein
MNLESLNVYMGMESQSFQTMNIFLRDIDDLDALGDRIYTAIDQSSVTDLDFAQEDLDEGEASLERSAQQHDAHDGHGQSPFCG